MTISAIIPVYNGEAYLAEAVASIQKQTLPADEIILVDDASTDQTPALIEQLAQADARIRSDRLPTQSGVAAARNRGVQLATGDLLAFLDADDLWTPEKLRSQVEALEKDARHDMVFGYIRQFFDEQLTDAERATLRIDQIRPALAAGGMLIYRSAFEAVGEFSSGVNVGEFIDWYIRARRRYLHEQIIPEVTLLRRVHRANMTRIQNLSTGYARVLKSALDDARRLPALDPVLRNILDSGIVTTADGESVPLRAHVEETSCYLLQYLIRLYRPRRFVEVGFAYGISAMAMMSAASHAKGLSYTIIDATQSTLWQGIGLANMERAGFSGRYTFMEQYSELALPDLYRRGEKLEFAFIDGYHTFDQTLIDFYYVNKMLVSGGVVVFDDATMPAVARLMQHIETYPCYERITLPREISVNGQQRRIDNPDRLVAFLKIDIDQRAWDWHVDF